MADAYLTLAKPAQDEYIVKRSRFIGYATPAKTQEEALAFLSEIRARHWDATHNVYAYILRENQIKRYSDDGEPQGTAGVPVLDVLQKEGLTDCAVVVTRYFGGILLGGGGLVRAYSHAAKLAVDAASVIKMELCCVLFVRCGYSFYGKLNALVADFGGEVQNTVFDDAVSMTFSLPKTLVGVFGAKLTDASLGKLSAICTEERFLETK
ncbi:MAG: YigZ family protein [Oscillospiraceae bacterium]|jgi:uncharacterized YigZ family protein|nr:YigZ family protein [Oscillospiraceae bacterium]